MMLQTTQILNPSLLAALAAAGHGRVIVIADAGLPCPAGVPVIDVSVIPGLPGFVPVVRAILAAGAFESCVIATESSTAPTLRELSAELAALPAERISHTEFKERLAQAAVIVRTGECTPFANIGLIAGVTF